MKKKVFLQKSIILYIGLALFLSMMAASVYGMVEFITAILTNASWEDWIGLIAVVCGFIFMAYTFLRMARNRIVLNTTEIFVPANWGDKNNKIQYETHIHYAEIQDMFIIVSDKNSLNTASRWVFTPMPYIIFDCYNGEQKAINVFYYSKKQVVKIIDETISRARQLGNESLSKTGEGILSEFLESKKKKK